MKYQIKTLLNTNYCKSNPQDPSCHRIHTIKAKTKIEAVMQIHEDDGYRHEDKETKNTLPVVWEVV